LANYYECLGVARDAAASEIRQAYRKLAKRYHPDVNGGDPQAAARFKDVVEAYETLSDEGKRAAYDEKLARESFASPEQAGNEKAGANGRQAAGNAAAQANPFDPGRVKEHFEQFFGMPPKGKGDAGKAGGSNAKSRNPLDTTDIFNHYFGKRSK